jgi:hypothetical protein
LHDINYSLPKVPINLCKRLEHFLLPKVPINLCKRLEYFLLPKVPINLCKRLEHFLLPKVPINLCKRLEHFLLPKVPIKITMKNLNKKKKMNLTLSECYSGQTMWWFRILQTLTVYYTCAITKNQWKQLENYGLNHP